MSQAGPLEHIETVVRSALNDQGARFVFPSGVAADFWLRESLGLGGPMAASAERFLSWDDFKRQALRAEDRPGSLPATRASRLIFSHWVLLQNSKEAFLSDYLSPDYATEYSRLVPGLARALPALPRVLAKAPSASAEPSLRDYACLHARYSSFLADTGRFEPSWDRARVEAGALRYHIFLPELIEDLPEFEPCIRAAPEGAVRIHASPPYPLSGLALSVYPSILEEIKALFDALESLLGSGEMPESIAVSVPGFQSLRPHLEREAWLRGMPADFRSGLSLSEYPSGRFFALIGACSRHGFSFQDLRDILLSLSLPWKDEASARALVEYGRRNSLASGWDEGGISVDPWEACFACQRPGPAEAGIAGFYRGLTKLAREMTGARRFSAIRRAYGKISRVFLNREGMEPELDRVFARCFRSLEELDQCQESLGIGELEGAYTVFLRQLEAERYVRGQRPGGLRFYDYRVGAGIRPRHHFIVNAWQRALAVRGGGCDFLREDLRSSLGLEDRDLSADFLQAYAQSGQRVSLSLSRQGPDGAQMPHGLLLSLSESVGIRRRVRLDAESLERHFWTGSSFPPRLSPVLARGMGAALETSLRDRGPDLCKEALAPCATRALDRLRIAEGPGMGLYRLSYSALRSYTTCPFNWFYSSACGLKPRKNGLRAFDQFFLGNVVHRGLEFFYTELMGLGALQPARRQEYLALIPSVVARLAREFAAQRGPLAQLLIESIRMELEEALRRCLDRDLAEYPGFFVSACELGLAEDFPGLAARLEGRLDRLMERGAQWWVIDYKTSTADKIRKIDYSYSAEGGYDLQIPVYARLLRAKAKADGQDHVLAGAEIYALGGGLGVKLIAGQEGFMSLAEVELAQADLEGLMGQVLGKIGAGDFGIAEYGDRKAACAGCALKSLCRAEYALR